MSELMQNEFEQAAAEQTDRGFLTEYWYFLRHHKAWWLLPILILLMLFGELLFFFNYSASTVIYTLF
jgi:uncharacterized protein YdaL